MFHVHPCSYFPALALFFALGSRLNQVHQRIVAASATAERKFLASVGRAYLTGSQALLRITLDHARRDEQLYFSGSLRCPFCRDRHRVFAIVTNFRATAMMMTLWGGSGAEAIREAFERGIVVAGSEGYHGSP